LKGLIQKAGVNRVPIVADTGCTIDIPSGVFSSTVKELARIETAIGIEPSYEEPAPSTHKTP